VADGIAMTKAAENSFIICGELAYQHIMDFVDFLANQKISSQDPLLIDFSECEIEDGITLLATVKTLCALAKHVPQLIIKGAPEILASELFDKSHNISLRNTRELEFN